MLPELISAGSQIIGGIIGKNSAEKAQKQNIQLQKDFAQHGIQWRVEDAKAAGIHPLAALGAQTTSFSPISVGGDPLAAGISGAGQDISRAVNATRGASARLDAYTKTVQDLNVRRMGLENDLLASQIAKINQTGSPPPMPSAGDRYLVEGQPQSGLTSPLVQDQALSRVAGAPGAPHSEAGAVTDLGYARTRSGWAPVMSKDFQERSEEDFLGGLAWNIRNRLGPSMFASAGDPPPVVHNADEYFIYNPVAQEYQLVKRSRPAYGFKRWAQ